MADNDRYTDPKDAGWHAIQSLTILGLGVLAIWLMVRFAMMGPGIYEGFQ